MNSYLKKVRVANKLIVSLLLAFTMGFTTLFCSPTAWAEEFDETVQIELNQVFQIIKQLHVSGIDERELADAAIRSMIQLLDDPHTVYFTSEEYSQFLDSMDQNIVGIGIRVSEDKQGVFVLEVFEGSPARAGGVQEEDYIKLVNGESVADLSVDQVASKIRGKEGTTVTVTVLRNGELLDLEMKRQGVSVPVVESKWLEGGIGYISLSSFSSRGGEEFSAQLADLHDKGIRSLILDLRNNNGGILDTAKQIAAEFIEEGTLIQTVNRSNGHSIVPISRGKRVSYPVIVLVNGMSASSAEVLAGALQDYKAADLLGTQTYGKGSVQALYRLIGGSAIKVTTEHYLTPKGHPVNEVGLTPDIIIEGSVPQLLTAVYRSLTKDEALTLSIAKHYIVLNSGKFLYHIPFIQEEGLTFIPARVLAPLIGGDLQWNGELKTVDFVNETKSVSFHVGGSVAMSDGFIIDGTSYINLDKFVEQFPQLKWRMDGELLYIEVVKK